MPTVEPWRPTAVWHPPCIPCFISQDAEHLQQRPAVRHDKLGGRDDTLAMAFCQIASDQAHADPLEPLPLRVLGHAAEHLGHIGSHQLQAVNKVVLLAVYRGVTTDKFDIFLREQLCPLVLLETKQRGAT